MGYRLELEGCSADSFESDTEVITVLEVNQVLDIIEGYVGDALKQIDGIGGIDDIDECKRILNELLGNLY